MAGSSIVIVARARAAVIALLMAGVLTACGADEPTEDAGAAAEEHAAGAEHISELTGDGTTAEADGFSLVDVTLPERAGEQGTLSFRIRDGRGKSVVSYVTDQTKDLHLYVVSDDYRIFRHLHPTLADGTWTTRVTLPEPGTYRVVAEFIAKTGADAGEWRLVGARGSVGGEGKAPNITDPQTDGSVAVTAQGAIVAGPDRRMTIRVTDSRGRPVRLGTYLGAYAHVTVFHPSTGKVIHMHPLGQPEFSPDGTSLQLHTEFEEPGDYVAFVQVRVDGFLHTLRLPLSVATG